MSLRVLFRRPDDALTFERVGVTADLGLGGASIETSGPPPEPGSALLLRFVEPSARETVELPANVRWVRSSTGASDSDFGVHFDALSQDKQSALHALISLQDDEAQEAPAHKA